MVFAIVLSIVLFSVSMCASPGPVNVMIISSSLNHGFLRTLPFINGATLGLGALMAIAGGFVVGQLQAYPEVLKYLNYLGCAFIIYLGIKIFMSRAQLNDEDSQPPGFLEGVVIQWVNPKSWVAAVSGVTLFCSNGSFTELSLFVLLFSASCYVSLLFWGVMGIKAANILKSDLRMRYFNMFLGATLAATALYMLAMQVATGT
ncbi:LysE family translocator [Pseudomonas syringae]|uniref:LysE family translocator n=1 Tax=Pseudomonas syringae TaxID=317 RepID=UPI0018E614DC|nr:LysE family translocator [Pseudomonas syringae]MBI6753797.1 LysE family translocator [Pseudomonas syringae]MBI6773301.1 LysE family translocator [Pseudomonas syringae]MBI6779030.1 LysE family translocator [Pseudomonas syringae]MBI6793748.1 LysE family translocator [Pseudomonas syringae]MBI6804237.1 LysE family translocator [Pseudomonas syringae]